MSDKWDFWIDRGGTFSDVIGPVLTVGIAYQQSLIG